MRQKKRILILRAGNSARSQMAEGLLSELEENGFAKDLVAGLKQTLGKI